MELRFGDLVISDDKSRLDLQAIHRMLLKSYWARTRSAEQVAKTVKHSRCYGVYGSDGRQVAFARVVTDETTVYYLCDVIVDENFRGSGIGKALIEAIVQSEELSGMSGMLHTADAHELYGRYGFVSDPLRFMRRPADL